MPKRTIISAMLALLGATASLNAQYVRIGDAGAIPNSTVRPPTILRSTLALYTEDARTHAIEGTVTIEALIDEDGRVRSSRVLKGLGFGLDEVALESVQEWTFSPATQDGVPVALAAQVDVEFNLRDTNALPIGAGITPPKVLSTRDDQQISEWSEETRRAKITDITVILQAVVKTDGSVDVVRVVQGFPFGVTDRVIAKLKQWKFTPGRRDGQDIDVVQTIEFQLRLR